MRTVHRLVTRQGRRQPFVMILEDMQWVDSETHAAMDALVDALPPYALVASTYRPEYVDRWSRHPGYTQVRVDALAPPATGDMLEALLGDDPGLVPLKRLVAERANGNPLFLEECVTTLVETGALAGERGAYRLTRPVLSLEVPATVRATIASRIDRLRYEDKRLLQAASVIGDAVPVRLLETVADVPTDEVRRGLDQLHGVGLLDQRALFPDLEYGFRHALVHDVAYESLLHERRRTLHARILEAIEGSYEGGRLVEQTERLAHHAFLGEVWDRAVSYCRQAGGRTLARMASWESVLFFERALAALAHRPADPEQARTAWSSLASGAPKSAMMPSPITWLTVPSYRCTASIISSRTRSMTGPISSGSRSPTASIMPWMSAKSTVTCLRSPSSASRESRMRWARCGGV
jgi:predicted ATPase